jgi:formylglycine-generating enzyme required for sulfatase activity
MTKIWLLGLVALAFALVVGCGAPANLEVPTLREAGVVTCNAAKDPLHPLIVEWTADDRTQLEAALQRGPVIVSYEGCNLKVLRACTARDAGHYDVVATTPAEQRIEIATTADLYANLPLSVATLEGKLARSGGLSLTYVAVGQRSLSGSPTLLDGDCEGASHFVDAMVLGAFDLTARAAGGGSAEVKAVNGAKVGGGADAKRELGGSAGDVALCKKQGLTAGPSCSAVLSLALSPLRRVSRVMPADRSLPSLAVIPDLANVQSLGRRDALGKVDIRLLELVESARKTDGDAGASSRAKASAWNALAAHDGADAYRPIAEKRRDDWLRIAEAQEATHARVMQRCGDYRADKAKLARLTALADVVTEDEKSRAQHTFSAAYGPWKTELEACPVDVAETDGMVAISGGTFVMGAKMREGRYLNYGGSDDVGPPHRVAVADYKLDVTEVTNGAYRKCVAAKACTPPCAWAAKDDLPVSCVDRDQARAYCGFADKRLPTEEEWEYAVHGLSFSNNDLPSRACYDHDRRGPCRVGERPPAANGLYDMLGNVWEWTDSSYTASYASELTSTFGVIRGGAYSSPVPEMLHADYRGAMDPHRRAPWVGFRCARSG